MIKFRTVKDDLIGFGLSEKNVEMLKKGRPILVHLRELGFAGDTKIAIFYGKDEESMERELKAHGFSRRPPPAEAFN